MKLSAIQENLKQGILLTAHIAGKNPNLPILSNLLIKAKKNIKIVATNLDIGITALIRGKVEKEGSFTVDAKKFSEFISLLPNQKINIEQIEKNLTIKTENYKTKIIGESSEEYPIIPKLEKNNLYKVKVKDIKNALSQTIFSTSNNETRLELSGVFFHIKDNTMTLAATDSFRLVEKKIKIFQENKNEEEIKTIIPTKTLEELLRTITLAIGSENNNAEEDIEFYIGDNQILFVFANIELISRLIEGQYPDYRQIIPANIKTSVLVNKKEFIRAIKTSALFSRTGANDINLDFPKEKNKTIVSASSGEAGENIVEIDSQVSGEDNSVTVNYRYLLDVLQVIKDENIKIEIVNNNTPCIIKPEKEENYLYIIMPIKN